MNRIVYTFCIIMSSITCMNTHTTFMQISTESEFLDALKHHSKIVAQFSSNHCSVCKLIHEPFMQSVDEHEDIAFAYIDTDLVPSLVQKYKITGLPTFLYIKESNVIQKEVGASAPTFHEDFAYALKKYLIQSSSYSEPSGLEKLKEIIGAVLSGIKHFIAWIYKLIFG